MNKETKLALKLLTFDDAIYDQALRLRLCDNSLIELIYDAQRLSKDTCDISEVNFISLKRELLG